MLDLTIVVVSFNTRELLRACLRSLEVSLAAFAARGQRVEVVVVDNASADDSADLVRREFPLVRLIASPRNLGFAAANNLAIRSSESHYVGLLNPDAEVIGDALTPLVEFLDANPAAAAAAPRLVYPDGSFQHSAFRFPNLWMSLIDFFPLNHRLIDSRLNGRYPRRWYERGEPFPIDHPLGACFVVRRAAIDQIGLLDEGFFMYCEEVDWCLRLRRAGWEIYCYPAGRVVHHVGQSASQFREKMFVELHRSRFRLFRQHYSPAFAVAARWAVRLGLLSRAAGDIRARLGGRIDRAELTRRLDAYGAVLRVLSAEC